ncbi:MAG: hypothetical protein G01um101472_541, partial [Parcubacteria group bacterium Gr01-1014_72]
VLNAVSLSGPGLRFLLDAKRWQSYGKPMLISVMSLAKTPSERKAELFLMCEMIASEYRELAVMRGYAPQWGIQINFSCPNGGVDPNDLIAEVVPILEMADEMLPSQIPVMPKFGPEIHPASVLQIARAPRCDALCVFNTMPFGKHPTWTQEAPPIAWKGIFGTDDPKESPMAKRFPGFAGGYSGEALLPFLLEWLRKVRALGVTTPICGGGGILSPADAYKVFDTGADAISPGSIAMLAPTQVRKTIRAAHAYVRSHECLLQHEPAERWDI